MYVIYLFCKVEFNLIFDAWLGISIILLTMMASVYTKSLGHQNTENKQSFSYVSYIQHFKPYS